ncbi:MAG: hypothetical protein ACOY82_13610 [Pseudomonadota bacterium]
MFVQATLVWAAFWLAGLPDYYRQYTDRTLGVLCALLSVAFCLYAIGLLLPRRPASRMPIAVWMSFYYSVPFAIYDGLYCGVHLGHGAGYVATYWYLSLFYVSVWLTFVPIAWLLNRGHRAEIGRASASAEG